MNTEAPLVSIIIPMRNEAPFIEACLRSLLDQDYPADRMEIIVADAASEDASGDIVRRVAGDHPNVRLIDNPDRFVPHGLNRGIRAARGAYILRADAHAEYGRDYVSQCVAHLLKTRADNVGGPLITLPGADSTMARCIAAITAHPIVMGGSRFRTSMKEEYADGAFFGAFPRDLFDRIGYFNEALVRNQDAEFNSRILSHGGKIFKTPKIVVRYYNQRSLRGLLRQAFRNGFWIVLALCGNLASFRFRYFAPFGFVCWLIGFAILSVARPMFLWPLGAAALIYAAVMALVTVQIARSHGLPVARHVPAAMLGCHLVYGIGTLAGVLRFGVFGRDARRRAREGSRPPNLASDATKTVTPPR